ncbi:hypothetical protein OHA25_13255 [Nonomuraea sp. NBC_00507]
MVERPTLYSVARSARDTSPSAYRRRAPGDFGEQFASQVAAV